MKRLLINPVRQSRAIKVGRVVIGGGATPVIQSMTNTDTADIAATVAQIQSAAHAGAQIMRVAVPDQKAAIALKSIVKHSSVPIVADIHFDYRLALASLEAGVSKLRINPGNIGSRDRVKAVVDEAGARNVPIRVGVNSGSLESSILEKHGHPTAAALAESALQNAAMLEDLGFQDIVLSLKGSDVTVTVDAYRLVAEETDYPLHIGITEAGTRWSGAIRSSVGLGVLLALGIGDTLRISLAADPLDEILATHKLFEALGIAKVGPTVIACPTCGRTSIDVITLANKVEAALVHRSEPLTVAVMGCVVNGPGEAREADIGIAGGVGEGLLFRKGKPIGKVPEERLLDALLELFDEVAAESKTP